MIGTICLCILFFTGCNEFYALSIPFSRFLLNHNPSSIFQTHQITQDRIFNWFIGFYDNIDQATIDLHQHRPTAALGGHEHVTATFLPYSNNHTTTGSEILASFTFGYNISKNFRYRLYQFVPSSNNSSKKITNDSKHSLRMRIYRPTKETENRLKQVNYDPKRYYPDSIASCFQLMEGCDVIWQPDGLWNRIIVIMQHWLPKGFINRFITYRGKLVNGQAEVASANNPNMMLTVKDDLRLRHNELWINDQVFLKNGTRIIGNTRGIPYKFKKMQSSRW